MWILVLSLIAAGVLIALFRHRYTIAPQDEQRQEAALSDCSSCSGGSEKCEQECMMEAAVKEIEYFDDEELDAYKGRRSDSYTDEEAEQFAEVLYTMKAEEVAEWNRSLILRGINLPDQVKDEVMCFLSD